MLSLLRSRALALTLVLVVVAFAITSPVWQLTALAAIALAVALALGPRLTLTRAQEIGATFVTAVIGVLAPRVAQIERTLATDALSERTMLVAACVRRPSLCREARGYRPCRCARQHDAAIRHGSWALPSRSARRARATRASPRK